jgi:hypothetical protein
MEKLMATLDDLIPEDRQHAELLDFEACAHYYPAMDCVIFLQEDVPYRADRVDEFITILWRPDRDEVVGLKIKGFRFLFNAVSEILTAAGCHVSDTAFMPLISVVQTALQMRSATLLEKATETRIAEKKRLTEQYARAVQIIGDSKIDARLLASAA